MGVLKPLSLSIALAVASAASAAEYSITSTIVGYSGGALGGIFGHVQGSTLIFSGIPPFDTNLGMLTAVKTHYDFSGFATAYMRHTDDGSIYVSGLSGSFSYTTQVSATIFVGPWPTAGIPVISRSLMGSTASDTLVLSDTYGGSADVDIAEPAILTEFADTFSDSVHWGVSTRSEFDASLDGYPILGDHNHYGVQSIPTVDATFTYVYQPVPEPASLLVGGALLVEIARRKRTQ